MSKNIETYLDQANNILTEIRETFTLHSQGLVSTNELTDKVFRNVGGILANIYMAHDAIPVQHPKIELGFAPITETSFVESSAVTGILICPALGSDQDSIVSWVHATHPDLSIDNCLEAHRIYRSYVDDGYSSRVARQYAGLL